MIRFYRIKEERGVKITIYVLQVDMNKQKYYITDLKREVRRSGTKTNNAPYS